MYNPLSIPNIFREIVETTASVVGYAINYRFGTRKVINEELTKLQNGKFPLIALVQGWDESYEQEDIVSINGLRILIAVRGLEEDKAQDRVDKNYVPTLNPLYKAFCEAVVDHPLFVGYSAAFKHTLKDWPNIGLENGERLFEDCADGKMIDNGSLKLNLKTCLLPKPVCYYTPCPNGRITDTLIMFKRVTILGLQSGTLSITIPESVYIVTPPTLPIPFVPDIDPGDGGPILPMPNSGTFTIDVTGLQDGYYIGTITFLQAQVQFYYQVANGQVVHHTAEIFQTLTPDYSCQEYYDTGFNSIEIGIIYKMARRNVENPKLTGYALTLFNQPPVSQTFTAVDTVTKTTTKQTKYNEGVYLITQDVSIDSHTLFSNVTFLKTKCSN